VETCKVTRDKLRGNTVLVAQHVHKHAQDEETTRRPARPQLRDAKRAFPHVHGVHVSTLETARGGAQGSKRSDDKRTGETRKGTCNPQRSIKKT